MPLGQDEESNTGGPGVEFQPLHVGTRAKLRQVLSLWPYMLPLSLVYFFEYALQSGVWAAVGFPLVNKGARKKFYDYSNTVYQLGVFFSRSSGLLCKTSYRTLALMPAIQGVLFVLFWCNAIWMWLYNYTLMIPCFLVGLIGGSIYVGMFSLLSELEGESPATREFNLTATSLGDSIGIILSNIAGIFIQKSIYAYHGIHD